MQWSLVTGAEAKKRAVDALRVSGADCA
eukprot:COSAG02_NODE_15293_length_1184_cov_0.795392_1_plen_27_part_10